MNIKIPTGLAQAPDRPSLTDTYLALVRDWSLWQQPISEVHRRLTRTLTQALNVERASIWSLNRDGSVLELDCLYQRDRDAYSADAPLLVGDYPAYFTALKRNRVIAATDAQTDPRTREFTRDYLVPLGIGALLDTKLRATGSGQGMICIEHVGGPRIWHSEEVDFVSSVADLLALLLIHQETRQNAAALSSLNALQRAILDSATYGIIGTDAHGTIVMFNKAAERMLGYRCDEVLGRMTPVRIHVREEIERQAAELTARLGHPVKPGFEAFVAHAKEFGHDEREWTYVRKDGSTFPVRLSVTVLHDALGKHTGYLGIATDITQNRLNLQSMRDAEHQLQERNRILDIINRLAEQLLSVHDEDDIGRLALTALEDITACDYACFSLQRNGTISRRSFVQHGALPISDEVPLGWPALAQEAMTKNQVLFSQSVSDDPRITDEGKRFLAANNIHSIICAPMCMAGEAMGIVCMLFTSAETLPQSLADACTTVSRMIAMALTNARQIANLNAQAQRDSLTGLPNRQALHRAFDVVRGEAASHSACALLLLDLDHFKEINDTLGHHVGDKVLQEIGPRLTAALHAMGGLACRLGGDEFALLLPQVVRSSDALALAQELTRTIRQPFWVDGMALSVSTSIGIAMYPEHGNDIHHLLRAADVAMYEAKRKGLGCLPYDRSDDRYTPERLILMNELGNAIEQSELRVYFQPKIDLASQAVVGFEALARWQHPRLGLLTPARFMPLAEVSEIIHPFTVEILRLTLQQQKRWREQGYLVSVAVNLSARNLVDDRAIDAVEHLLTQFDTPWHGLELEITETSLMTDPEGAARRLRRAAELGVRISIDDFGTGHSSLGYLRNLPIDTLKIDRSFVAELADEDDSATIVRSIISLAHNLKLTVVAEGIEDPQTQHILASIGCDQAQGYHISPPLPAEAMTDWLQRWQAGTA